MLLKNKYLFHKIIPSLLLVASIIILCNPILSLNAYADTLIPNASFEDKKTASNVYRCPGTYYVYEVSGPDTNNDNCLTQHFNDCSNNCNNTRQARCAGMRRVDSRDILDDYIVSTDHYCNGDEDDHYTIGARVRTNRTKCRICGNTSKSNSGYITVNDTCKNNPRGGHYIVASSDGKAKCKLCNQEAGSYYKGRCPASYTMNKTVKWNTSVSYVSPMSVASDINLSGSEDQMVITKYNSTATIDINSLLTDIDSPSNGTIVGYSVYVDGKLHGSYGSSEKTNSDFAFSKCSYTTIVTNVTKVQFRLFTQVGSYVLPTITLVPRFYYIDYDLSDGGTIINGEISSSLSTGGSATLTNAPLIGCFNTWTVIPNPVREGFIFLGWQITGMDNGNVPYEEITDHNHSWSNETHIFDTKKEAVSGTISSASDLKDNVTYIPSSYTKFYNLRVDIGQHVLFTALWMDTKSPQITDPDGSNMLLYENIGDAMPPPDEKNWTGTVKHASKYVVGNWTGQSVRLSAKITDETGISSMFFVTNYPSGNKNTEEIKTSPVSKIFSITGTWNGTITAFDNAGNKEVASSMRYVINPDGNLSTIKNIGPIKIDKQKPTGSISYGYCKDPSFTVNMWTYNSDGSYKLESQISNWNKNGNEPTNKNVVVKIIAKDSLSGIHKKSAYSWDHGKTWTNKNTKIFDICTTDYVYVRDNVGNWERFDYAVTNIDKKVPIVYPQYEPKSDDVPNEPLPKDPNNPQNYNYPSDSKYTYEKLGKLTYDWVNNNVEIAFKSDDTKSFDNKYSASGIARMEIFKANSNFQKGESIAKSTSTFISYIIKDQGITNYVIEAEDYATNVTTVNLTVKIDKTAPVIDQSGHSSDFYIEDIDLNKYGIDEVESKIKNSSAMKRKFRFKTTDYNDSVNGATKDPSDSSGICKFTMRLFNMDDLSDYKEYDLSQYLSGTAKNTKEFSSSSGIKAILEAIFGTDINTFAEFPNAAALNYELTIEDRAGNKTVYKNIRGNEIKNFSIKAVIYYADVHEEEVLSSEYADYDSSYTQLNSSDTDSNGKVTNVPYFRTGDFGYVEAWTIGYVPKIQFDFSDVGLVTANNIHDNKLDELYNLGITSNIFYDRQISYVNGEKIDVSVPDNNGIPYACHYGGKEKASSNGKEIEKFKNYFEENGTSIRISPYYILEKDNTNKKDGTSNYKWEVHNANIIALKGSGAHSAKSYPSYVLWDTGSFDVHHRVTHES